MENGTQQCNFVTNWLRTKNLQLPSWGLHKCCKSACCHHLSLLNHIYPQLFLKKSGYICVPLLLPPAMWAQPTGCLCPPCCQRTLSPYHRQEQKADSLPCWHWATLPLLQPGLTQCLQSKPVTEQHCSQLEERCSPYANSTRPYPTYCLLKLLLFCLQFKVCMHMFVCACIQRSRYEDPCTAKPLQLTITPPCLSSPLFVLQYIAIHTSLCRGILKWCKLDF